MPRRSWFWLPRGIVLGECLFLFPGVCGAEVSRPTEARPGFYPLRPAVFATGNAQATFEYFAYQPLEE